MKSLDSAMRVLMALMGNQQSFGVSELAERLDMPKSQVSKVLASLRRFGLVKQDNATRRYSVGLRAFALGSRFLTYDRLAREAIPILRALVDETGHSARLSVRDGDDVIYLFGLEGPHFIDTGWRAGTLLPWHASSAARILLAYTEKQEVARILDLQGMPALTPHTTTTRSKLMSLLARAKECGFSAQRDETTVGLATVSVPIFGEGQTVVGALSLAFPEASLPADQEAHYASVLHRNARLLSIRMGSLVYPFHAAHTNGAV